MARVEVTKCDCQSKYQDEKYGKGNRLHNVKGDGQGKPNGLRCTICGKEKSK